MASPEKINHSSVEAILNLSCYWKIVKEDDHAFKLQAFNENSTPQ